MYTSGMPLQRYPGATPGDTRPMRSAPRRLRSPSTLPRRNAGGYIGGEQARQPPDQRLQRYPGATPGDTWSTVVTPVRTPVLQRYPGATPGDTTKSMSMPVSSKVLQRYPGATPGDTAKGARHLGAFIQPSTLPRRNAGGYARIDGEIAADYVDLQRYPGATPGDTHGLSERSTGLAGRQLCERCRLCREMAVSEYFCMGSNESRDLSARRQSAARNPIRYRHQDRGVQPSGK